MEKLKADLAVIGAGPAGQKGAIQGAKIGKKVVLVDRLGLLGGACLHTGTIPSKTLRMAILDLTGFLQSAYYGQAQKTAREISMNDLTFRVNKVIEDENKLLAEQCAGNGVEVVYGTARFTDAHTLEVLDAQGQVSHQVEAEKFLIAVGSKPRQPIDIPQDPEVFLDSDQVFRMEQLPKSLIVLGGGIIGCEYATMFSALGIQVLLLDRRELLRSVDGEITEYFCEYVKQQGKMEIRIKQPIKEVRRSEDGQAEVVMEDGECLRAAALFYSMGRIANLEGMQLEKAGIALNKLGNIPVNELFQSNCSHIYAAGDVIGPPGLASTAIEQGRLAVRNAFAMKTRSFPEFFPTGIYTIPEISSVGPTEEELKQQGVHYEVGRAHYREIARGPIAGDISGMIKLLFHAETLEVLGVHIIGTLATEVISIGQIAIHFHARVDYFVETIFNYPTFAEGYRIAALNGLNKLKDSSGLKRWS